MVPTLVCFSPCLCIRVDVEAIHSQRNASPPLLGSEIQRNVIWYHYKSGLQWREGTPVNWLKK